jgi:hypothetical protein
MRDLQLAGAWLARHGLDDSRPTPELAARIAVRRTVHVIDSVLLAVLIIAAALVQTQQRFGPEFGGSRDRWPMLALGVLVLGLVVSRWLLDRWVRRVDRRAGAGLARRAAHAVPPDWRAVLGVPLVVFTLATVAGALALGLSALALDTPVMRDAAVVLLIGLSGVLAAGAVQIRHLLTRPVVADDEASLTADLAMRIEDGRTATTPGVLWSLPVVLLFGTAPGWLSAASIVLVVAGVVALAAISARTPKVGAAARRAMAAAR